MRPFARSQVWVPPWVILSCLNFSPFLLNDFGQVKVLYCQVWSMFTAEPLPLRVHHTSTHTHKHTQCVHTFHVPILQCLSPIILLESNYVPLAPLWCYRQHRIVLYALLHKASVLLLSSSHESYDDKHGFLFSPRNTLFTQPYPTIMKHLPSNHW